MKKYSIIALVTVVVLLFMLILNAVLFLKGNKEGTIIIDGKCITDIPLTLDPIEQNMLVPVIAILQRLGYAVTEQEADIVLLEKDNKQFVLNLEELTLVEAESEHQLNYLESPPGFYYNCCYREENDIMLDVVTFNSALYWMESGYHIGDFPKLKLVFLY